MSSRDLQEQREQAWRQPQGPDVARRANHDGGGQVNGWSDLTLLHYTPASALVRPSGRYPQSRPQYKPDGLWLSESREWRRWCEDESFGALGQREIPFGARGINVFRVYLADDARIRWLRTPEEIRAFHCEFCGAGSDLAQRYVNWSPVIERWDGVLISPYQWRLRLDNDISWYYMWDVSSACVWDWRAISRVEPYDEPAELPDVPEGTP